MNPNKKVVAAISMAVTSYIREENASMAAAQKRPEPAAANVWGQTGRREIMRNRQMWQMRIISR